MIRWLAIASLLFAIPAMVGESIVIPPLPYTKKCLQQYGSIESCIAGLVEVSRRLTIERDALKVIEPVPRPEAKPVVKAKVKKKVQVCVRRNATRCTWLKWVWK